MWRYVVKRVLMMIPVLIGISIFVFLLMHLTPGDPALLMLGEHAPAEQLESLRKELGLDQPLFIQYFNWARRAVRLDFGRSLISKRLVTTEISERLGASAELALVAVMISMLVGIPMGIISAIKPNSILDNVGMVFALAGIAMPAFWQGLMLIIIFSVHLAWLPSSGRMGGWEYYVLPSITLSTISMASIARMTRSAMLEVIQQDYIRTAQAKGLSKRVVILKHALRNALIPVVTIIGLQFGGLMAGAVLTETIFAWPGIGRLVVERIQAKDFPTVQGTIMTFAFVYALINLLVDLLYAFLNPRLREKYN